MADEVIGLEWLAPNLHARHENKTELSVRVLGLYGCEEAFEVFVGRHVNAAIPLTIDVVKGYVCSSRHGQCAAESEMREKVRRNSIKC